MSQQKLGGQMPDTKIFDREELLSRLCDDEELLGEIIQVYLEDTPQQIQTLKDAQRQGDAELIHKQGHTIKGASGNVAALQIRQTAYEIESAGKNGRIEDVQELIAQLESQFHALQEYLGK